MSRGLVFIKAGNVKNMQEKPVFEDREALLRLYEERWVDARSANAKLYIAIVTITAGDLNSTRSILQVVLSCVRKNKQENSIQLVIEIIRNMMFWRNIQVLTQDVLRV